MLTSVLNHIRDNILSLNPNTFQKGYAGARQYQDGKVVIYDASNGTSEGAYVGLKDNENNYFYIRYLSNFELDVVPTEKRSTSCDELQGVANMRLVAWVKNADFGKLVEVLINDISSTDFSTMTAADRERFSSDPEIAYSAIQPDPEQIYKDETLTENEQVKLPKGVTIVAIDFGVVFTYKMKRNDCIDRDVCVGCAA